MRLNSKGFGSKEFFAVFIIISILVVALVPIILGYVKDSREEVLTDSVVVFRNEVNKAILLYINGGSEVLDGCYFVTKDGNICLGKYDDNGKCSTVSLEINIDGSRPDGGTVDIEGYRVINLHNIMIEDKYVNIKDDEYYVTMEPETRIFCR